MSWRNRGKHRDRRERAELTLVGLNLGKKDLVLVRVCVGLDEDTGKSQGERSI